MGVFNVEGQINFKNLTDMKTIVKQIMGFTIMLIIMTLSSQAWSQSDNGFYTVRGVVKDKSNQKRLEYAVVSIHGSNIGTIANSNGEFSVKIKDELNAKNLEISHLGYGTVLVPVTGKETNDITVYMQQKPSLLDEITIVAVDPAVIVEKAVSRIADNYSKESNMLTAFYRETVKKRRSYINVSEAIVDLYKTPYREGVDRDQVQIYKGRKLVSPKAEDTLMVKLLGGPNLSIYIDIVKNPDLILNPETLNYYKYTFEEGVMIGDRAHYVISFKPQVIMPYALYNGKLFIDKESLSFTRAEFNLSMSDRNKATQAILKKKPYGMHFKPELISFLVNYRQRDGLTHLNYIRSEVQFKCDWKKRLFSTNYTIVSETVITGTSDAKAKRIPYRLAFNDNQALSDKVINFYDNNFWEDYNIIEPEESLESAVNRLRKEEKR